MDELFNFEMDTEEVEPVVLQDFSDYVEVRITMTVTGKRQKAQRWMQVRGFLPEVQNSTFGLQAMMAQALKEYSSGGEKDATE